jgi:hypothetical protein
MVFKCDPFLLTYVSHKNLPSWQGDQIGRFFAYWESIYFGQFFKIYLGHFFHSKCYALILTKIGLDPILRYKLQRQRCKKVLKTKIFSFTLKTL